MRLLLRPDVYPASTSTGLCVLTHRGPVSFEGSSIATWLDRLRPYLDGRFGLEDLAAGLDEPRRDMLQRVVRALVDADIVRELPTPDDAEREHHGAHPTTPPTARATPEERYVAYFRTSAEAIVRRYQRCAALVVGSGPWADAVAHACSRSGAAGVETVRAVASSSAPAEEEGAADRIGAGIVLHVAEPADQDAMPRARRLSAWCRAAGAVLGHLTPLGDRALLGPVGTVRVETGWEETGWEDAWRRLVATHSSTAVLSDGPGRAERAVIANQLVHRAFRAHTGVAEPGEQNQVCSIGYDGSSSATHTLLGHPYTRPVEPRVPAGEHDSAEQPSGDERPNRDERLNRDEMSRRTAGLVDDHVGVFVEIAQRGFAQFPIHVSQAVVSDPVGIGLGPVRVFGIGPDFASARYQAALRGYAVYGSLALDPRRLTDSSGRPLGKGRDTPDDLLAALRRADPAGPPRHVRGHSLVDSGVRLVDLNRAFPVLDGATHWPVLGSASGYEWEQAVTSALLDHCRALALTALYELDQPVGTIDLSDSSVLHSDQLARHYAALLRATGVPVTVYDVTGLLDVPAVLLSAGGDHADMVCTTGISTPAALRDALEQALLAHQARVHGETAYAPPSLDLPTLPSLPKPPSLPTPASTATRTGGELTLEGLTKALSNRGYHPVVLPLDHDPEVTRRMPHIVQVVLDHD